MISPLLARPAAVAGDGAAAAVAVHYGEPLREQRLLDAGEALVDLSHRGVLTISGADRLTWLHSMTTQHLTGLAPGASAETLVLSPKGKIEHSLHLVDDGERCWITVEPGTAPALKAWLDSMRFMLRVEVEDLTERYAVIGSTRPWLPDAPVGHQWSDPWPGLVGDTAAYGPVAGHPGEGWRWFETLVPREDLARLVGERPLAGLWAAEALRIAAWRPRMGVDTDHRTIAHELDWLRSAVHLHKGCYRGQETIARVYNLGKPPRRIAFVHLDGSGHELPEAGAEVTIPGQPRPVGELTSVARHYEEGPIGLVVLKRNTATDAAFDIGGVAAAQTVIVAPD